MSMECGFICASARRERDKQNTDTHVFTRINTTDDQAINQPTIQQANQYMQHTPFSQWIRCRAKGTGEC